jgi:hypothetical protein
MFTSFLAGVIANETAPDQIDPGRRKAVFASPFARPGLGRTLSDETPHRRSLAGIDRWFW